MNKLPITITHPRSSVSFTAKVALQCPAKTVLAGLQQANATLDGPFLESTSPGRPYVLSLVRTGEAMSPDTTMAQAGVQANDLLAVDQVAAGAR